MSTRRLAPLAPLALLLTATAAPLHAQAPQRVSKSATDAPPPAGTTAGTLDAVVAAERAYARDAEARGMRDASLAAFADDGVVFRERIALAKPYWATVPAPGPLFRWAPAWGAASASGDLAFTTGPYTFRATAGDTAVSHGQFATVWTRQPNAGWKVLVDVGADGPPTADAPATPNATPAPAFVPRPLGGAATGARGAASSAAVAEGQRAMLLIADRGLAAAGRANGAGAALAAVAASDVRALWPGSAPAVGPQAASAAIAARVGRVPGAVLEYQTSEARVSRAGDLGVTWGTYALRGSDGAVAEQGAYLRVWGREGGGWRVLVDALSPAG
jgi:ketosteroid isomerase-like protein